MEHFITMVANTLDQLLFDVEEGIKVIRIKIAQRNCHFIKINILSIFTGGSY